MFRPRKLLVAAVLVLACVALAYSAFWAIEAHRLRAMIAAAAVSTDARPTLTAERLTVSGYPFDLTVELAGGVIEGRAGLLDAARITLPRLTANARPWSPTRWRFMLPQGAVAALPNGGAASIGSLVGKFQLGGNAVSQIAGETATIALSAADLVLTRDGRTTRGGTLELNLAVPLRPPADHLGIAAEFSLSARQIRLPQAEPPLGDTIASADIAGTVQGVIPDLPLAAALALWRNQGGTLEVRDLGLVWQGLTLSGNGTLALDASLQPIGAFSTSLTGYGAILDALVANGQLKPDEAHYMKMGLDLLAQPDAAGTRMLKAPVTVQDGGLYIGPARVAKLPTIRW